jgi:NAD-dependent deacetylase
MNKLVQLIRESKHALAFTGAGISTESGIPDFRSVNGVYTSGPYKGMSPESILTNRMMKTQPSRVLAFYKERLLRIVEKEPNAGHLALKKLEDMGKLDYVITQNIDNLHKKAGSQKVLELHGNGTHFVCAIRCGLTYTYDEFIKMMEKSEKPMCHCTMAPIRPDTVLFDECLPDDIFDTAYYACKQCDLMIVVGSSLVVQPACRLVDEIPIPAKLVIINKDKTPYDSKADLVIRESCGKVLEEAVENL